MEASLNPGSVAAVVAGLCSGILIFGGGVSTTAIASILGRGGDSPRNEWVQRRQEARIQADRDAKQIQVEEERLRLKEMEEERRRSERTGKVEKENTCKNC